MPDERTQSNSTVTIVSTQESKKSPPQWLAQAVVILVYWKQLGLLEQVNQIQWHRPTKRYVLTDLLLVLVPLAISSAPSVRVFYKHVAPYRAMLAAIWGRQDFPSRSNFSKMLGHLEPSRLEALEALFLESLLATVPSISLKGLVDHRGGRHLLFDMDPTKMASLEASRADDPTRQPVRPRRREATAPGYGGRKRSDRVRTRTTMMMMSTGLWVLTFGQPGNGQRARSIQRTCERASALLDGLAIPRSEGVVRMDGEWGRLATLTLLITTGLGYLCRGVEYDRLLGAEPVRAALARGATVEMTLPDSPVTRQVFDVPEVVFAGLEAGQQLATRVVVTRFELPEGMDKPRVGRLIDGWVYEVFLTDRRPECWTAPEVVSLYLGRGGFERTLALEDAEMQTDHWITDHGLGQDLFQLVCQWVWNQRVVLGSLVLDDDEELKRVLAYQVPTTPIEPEPVELSVASCPTAETASEQVAPTNVAPTRRGTFGTERFSRDAEGRVLCPAGHQMKRIERRQRATGLRERYQAPATVCAACPHRLACRGPKASEHFGRKVDLAALSQTGPAPLVPKASAQAQAGSASAPEPRTKLSSMPSVSDDHQEGTPSVVIQLAVLMMYDLNSTKARSLFVEALRQEQVVVKEEALALPHRTVVVVESRTARAHRRMSWQARLGRNARGPESPKLTVKVTGVPPRLAQAAGLLQRDNESSQAVAAA